MWATKPSLIPLLKNKLTPSTEQANHKHLKLKKIKLDQSRSLDKSRASERTETEDSVKTTNK